jgi:hypothetical protein
VLTTDGSGPYPCRVSTTNDDTETTATRPLFPFEVDLPVTKLSNLCAEG